MASVSTVFALIADPIEEEFATEGTHDDLIELSSNELVSVHFVDLIFALTNSTLTTETSRGIEGPLADVLLD